MKNEFIRKYHSIQHDSEIFQNIDKIIKGRFIKPVYQPIVSLNDGNILGYEALSRISNEDLKMDIGKMFIAANEANLSWELEELCRIKSLEKAIDMDANKKLFINVNPNVIHDEAFQSGFTKKCLYEYGLKLHNIIFEITERVSALDNDVFINSIGHYKRQDYKIAIDDVGAGYSEINTLSDVKPDLVKLDMNIVRNIDKDEIKQLLCKAMVGFCENAGIQLIAEGIENEEELETLIKLQVSYGQGFFLGVPQEIFAEIAPEKLNIIQKYNAKKYNKNITSSIYPIIGYLSKPGYSFSPDEIAEKILEVMKLNPTIHEFVIIENDKAIGFMTKTDLNEKLGGRYGFTLFSNKPIQQIINKDFLVVDYNMTVDRVSRKALQRPFEQLYNPIVVELDNKYYGIVTIKDLLDTCTKIDVDVAAHSNPLTKLPGNLLIEQEILTRVLNDKPYCITYYDLDNFKAYNDAYGFQNGDMMLALVANVLKKCATKEEFIGHIGGDDFIVICDYHEGEEYCQAVIDAFSVEVLGLYRDEDVKRGYIVSKNRNGVTENFPISSLSIAGISNRNRVYKSTDDFSKDIAQIKKKCKQQIGNYYEIH
ncbi:MAG: EAL and GGDEF domain-containing protein [Oscillospiraceae bacterium]|nr:EAL and GGDEF domain-containing protein [Oscillospiraceae bacterium]